MGLVLMLIAGGVAAAAFLYAAVAVPRRKAQQQDLGSVSGSWIADHRAATHTYKS